jgi:hypothetical protein
MLRVWDRLLGTERADYVERFTRRLPEKTTAE